MTRPQLVKVISFVVILLFILGWTVVLFFYTPKEIVELLGVHNTYLMTFLISVIGAFSSFTTFSTYPAILTFAAGQIDPFMLGIVAGLGLSIGDSLFYYFGSTARGIASRRFRKKLEIIIRWLRLKSDGLITWFVFFYVGFTPFPNNLLTGMLALSGYPYRKIALPLILGNIVLPTLAAFLTYKGLEILHLPE